MDRRPEKKAEPASYRYFRRAVEIAPFLQEADRRQGVESLLAGNTNLETIGFDLFQELGHQDTRSFVGFVSSAASSDLARNPQDKVAKRAADWAKDARRALMSGGWDPIEIVPQGYTASRNYGAGFLTGDTARLMDPDYGRDGMRSLRRSSPNS